MLVAATQEIVRRPDRACYGLPVTSAEGVSPATLHSVAPVDSVLQESRSQDRV